MIFGLVSHIQRFSVHDGPGIRTTLFLKGCQMRCAWCHNPETYKKSSEIQLFPSRCIACAACVEVCACGAIDEHLQYDRDKCVGCGACAQACFAKARTLVGQKMTAKDAMAEILADQSFYFDSGGGVTVSGGEPFCQSEFVLAILNECRHLGIHTAVETNLAVPFSILESAISNIDLFMVDVKIWDDRQHQHWTGMSNRQTLENLEKISNFGNPILLRTPIITGINDTVEQIMPIARFAATLPTLEYYELLPYHPLGEEKRTGLGLAPPSKTFDRPSGKRLCQIRKAAEQTGITVRLARS